MRIRALLAALIAMGAARAQAPALPAGVTPAIQEAVDRGLAWLARNQGQDGSWRNAGSNGSCPCAMTASAGLAFLAGGCTPTRGRYAAQVRQATDFLLRHVHSSGLITVLHEESRPMYGHGFAALFLAQVLGMEGDQALHDRLRRVLRNAVDLISASQSGDGGWYYHPDSNADEGSVTVTQMQALRACRDAGIAVPKDTVDRAVSYIARSANPDGGIRYMVRMGGPSRPAITAAAVATLYSAGKYDHPMAVKALEHATNFIRVDHVASFYFYAHLYLAQALYQKGGEEWSGYYAEMGARLAARQAKAGSWDDGQSGPVYATAVALTILQLPWGNVPAYRR